MRALGLALVTASLALSAGGVVYRRPALAQQAAAEPAPITQEQEICRARPLQPDVCHARPLQPDVRRARIAAPAVRRSIVSLGARGFNYSRPGDPVPAEIPPSREVPGAPRE